MRGIEVAEQTNMSFEFLIVGAGRGGTSLLAGLLDYHPRLVVALERYAIRDLMGDEKPPPKEHYTDLFDRRAGTFRQTCDELAARFRFRKWGNKITTEQVAGLEDHNKYNADPAHHVDVFDRFFNDVMSDVKVVFILRDGRRCVRSKFDRVDVPFDEGCRRWHYSVDMWRFLRDRHANNLRVHFEDLLAAPEETLRDICRFLGVRFRRRMLRGAENRKMRPEYRQSGIDASKLAPVELPAEVETSLEDALRETGYLQ